jgi:hypothetical protein
MASEALEISELTSQKLKTLADHLAKEIARLERLKEKEGGGGPENEN